MTTNHIADQTPQFGSDSGRARPAGTTTPWRIVDFGRMTRHGRYTVVDREGHPPASHVSLFSRKKDAMELLERLLTDGDPAATFPERS